MLFNWKRLTNNVMRRFVAELIKTILHPEKKTKQNTNPIIDPEFKWLGFHFLRQVLGEGGR